MSTSTPSSVRRKRLSVLQGNGSTNKVASKRHDPAIASGNATPRTPRVYYYQPQEEVLASMPEQSNKEIAVDEEADSTPLKPHRRTPQQLPKASPQQSAIQSPVPGPSSPAASASVIAMAQKEADHRESGLKEAAPQRDILRTLLWTVEAAVTALFSLVIFCDIHLLSRHSKRRSALIITVTFIVLLFAFAALLEERGPGEQVESPSTYGDPTYSRRLSELEKKWSQLDLSDQTSKLVEQLKLVEKRLATTEQSALDQRSNLDDANRAIRILQDLADLLNSKAESQTGVTAEEVKDMLVQRFEEFENTFKQEIAKHIMNVINQQEVPHMDIPSSISIETVQGLIKDALEVYSADKISLPDYALQSAGASIEPSLTSPTYSQKANEGWDSWFGRKRYGSPPSVILQPDNTVGNCWAFQGSKGNVSIELAKPVIPTAISLEHVAISVAHNPSSAPKEFTVWGLEFLDKSVGATQLGEFEYQEGSSQIQTFPVTASRPFSHVLLQVVSNHGNKEYTCIYRFRVHGNLSSQ